MWNENISCHINKREMLQPSAISGLQCEWGPPNWSSGACLHPQVIAKELEGCKKQGEKGNRLVADSWGVYERNEFTEPRGLHLPICRMLNSLTGYLIFDVQAACSLCCKLVYSLASPSASLEQFSQSYWDAVRVLNIPTKEKSSPFSRCDYIFQLTKLTKWK